MLHLFVRKLRRAPGHVVPIVLSSKMMLSTLPCRRTIMDDPFISNYIEDLLKNIRTQVTRQMLFCACQCALLHVQAFVNAGVSQH